MNKDRKTDITKIDDIEKKDLLKILLTKALDEKKAELIDNSSKIEILKQLKKSYERTNEFAEGDIIKWKNQLKNKKLPEYDEPVIILEILKEHIIDSEAEIGSTYYNESYDIKVGLYRDNTLLTFYYDSNRFEKFGE